MNKTNERYLKFFVDGSTRHLKTGDKFILDNYRRNTFVYSLFECPTTGMHFITPPTIRKQFSHKMKVWLAKLNVLPENNEGFYEEINDVQDVISRRFLGSNYAMIQKYDIKKTDETFMVFDTTNEYQFKGLFKPKEWQASEEFLYTQEFIKIADEIEFTPAHNQRHKQVDEDLHRQLVKILESYKNKE